MRCSSGINDGLPCLSEWQPETSDESGAGSTFRQHFDDEVSGLIWPNNLPPFSVCEEAGGIEAPNFLQQVNNNNSSHPCEKRKESFEKSEKNLLREQPAKFVASYFWHFVCFSQVLTLPLYCKFSSANLRNCIRVCFPRFLFDRESHSLHACMHVVCELDLSCLVSKAII